MKVRLICIISLAKQIRAGRGVKDGEHDDLKLKFENEL